MSNKKKLRPVPAFEEPFSRGFKDWKPGPCKTACEKELRSLMNDVESTMSKEINYGREEVMLMFGERMQERGMYPLSKSNE